MAKRVPLEEKPYRPVDDALVQSVLRPVLNGGGDSPEIGPEIDLALPPAPLGLASPPLTSTVSELPVVPRPEQEKLAREKRVLLSRSEEREVERLVADLTDTLCTPLKLSHVLRATVLLLRHAREEILTESQRVGPLKRPHNGEAVALVAFEHDLAQIIDRSLRNSPPLD
jgi:hypothetical protein